MSGCEGCACGSSAESTAPQLLPEGLIWELALGTESVASKWAASQLVGRVPPKAILSRLRDAAADGQATLRKATAIALLLPTGEGSAAMAQLRELVRVGEMELVLHAAECTYWDLQFAALAEFRSVIENVAESASDDDMAARAVALLSEQQLVQPRRLLEIMKTGAEKTRLAAAFALRRARWNVEQEEQVKDWANGLHCADAENVAKWVIALQRKSQESS